VYLGVDSKSAYHIHHPALEGAQVNIKYLTGEPKPTIITELLEVDGFFKYTVHNDGIETAKRAVFERVYLANGKPPPKVDGETFYKLTRESSRRLKKYLKTCHPMRKEDFPSSYRDARRRKIYTKAVESLEFRPITWKDSYISGFVKKEKICITLKPDPAPRLIQPRSPRYNVELGVYIKPAENLVYDAISELFGGRTVAKGLNALERGNLIAEKWNSLKDPVAIGIDARRFDQHVRKEALKMEHAIYKHLYRSATREERDRLAWLLSMQLQTTGFVNTPDGTLKYKVEGGRCSGDMNTSLGNVLIMCLAVDSWATSVGLRGKAHFINDGDDGVIFMEREDLAKAGTLPAFFKKLGFNMKVEEPAYYLEDVEFCQCRPVATVDGYKMVRSIGKMIGKDTLTWKEIDNEKYWNAYRLAISKGGLALAGDIPVASAFYRMLGRGAGTRAAEIPMSGMMYLARGMQERKEITAETRASFCLAFNCTPDEQRSLEAKFDSMNPTWAHATAPLKVSQIIR
jgi:hypothetical protein